MASKRAPVLAAMLFCLSYSLLITGQDLSKHLVTENGSKLRRPLIGDAKPNKASARTTRDSPIKAASDDSYTHVAGYQSKGAIGNTWWHGVSAKISVWNIQDVQPYSQSSAYIAAISNWDGLEYVAAGVHVYPRMYNNSDLRFFTYWTTIKDGTEGCYNDHCPGFVIANGSNLLPGQALAPLSIYGGETRYITITIKKDEKTGDWSLYREDKGGPIGGMTLLGWWPQSLFKSLSDRANVIQWTGEVDYQYNETGPTMGSGHFSDEHEGKAAGFFDVYGFDGATGLKYNHAYSPIPFVDKSYCYDTSPWYDPDYNYPLVTTHHFFYGGPSGCSR